MKGNIMNKQNSENKCLGCPFASEKETIVGPCSSITGNCPNEYQKQEGYYIEVFGHLIWIDGTKTR